MTHMHIPTVPTARDTARGYTPRHRRTDVKPDFTGPYDVTDSPGRHRKPIDLPLYGPRALYGPLDVSL